MLFRRLQKYLLVRVLSGWYRVDGDLDTLDAFDNISFVDAMRREMLFGRTAANDANLGHDGALVGSDDGEESGRDSSEASSEEDEVEPTFETTEEEFRELTANGWTTYDAGHCGELQLSVAADYYDGPSGPTRPALAFADCPLGLFFYFLPKKLWICIAEESNRYRSQLIAVKHCSVNIFRTPESQYHR
ncbi:hypothetical protein DVH05_011494 [Phytophthora capsici]|nr:hypothetical protein DVH05_011494 [Phytophthora capsici]